MSGRRVCGAEVYSVFYGEYASRKAYGEYASRKAALEAKNDLPEVLRKISPIPRSVGGILKEIQRLETES
jgi:septal ring-binding cell division protein DamX